MKNIIILLLAVLVVSCSKKEETAKQEFAVSADGSQVTLTEIQYKNAGIATSALNNQNIGNSIMLKGQIDVPPQAMAGVSSSTGGIVKVSRFMEGNYVSRGQTLAVVENPELAQMQQDYLQAKANLGYAQKDYERQRYLHQYQATSTKQMQKAQSEAQNQSAAVNGLAAKMKAYGISPSSVSSGNIQRQIAVVAPISGFISRVNVAQGQYVSPAEVLFEIVNPSKTHLALKVFEKDLPKISIGQRVFAFTNQSPEKKYAASVALIGKDFAPDRSVMVHCELIDNSPVLIPGTFMNAQIETDTQEGFIIPDDAIVTWEGKQYIFEQVKKHTYKMYHVTIGNSENGFTQLLNFQPPDARKVFVTKGAYQLLMALKNVEE